MVVVIDYRPCDGLSYKPIAMIEERNTRLMEFSWDKIYLVGGRRKGRVTLQSRFETVTDKRDFYSTVIM
jgi:hypothetical protein